MLIYRHHTAVDIIDLDDHTGNWTSVQQTDDDPIIIGQMSMAQRADCPIRGSYTIENDKRCCFYWTEGDELVFRTPDNRRLALLRRDADGRLVDLMPNVVAELRPAVYGDGRPMPQMSRFALIKNDGNCLFELTYDSERYLQYYLGNFTFVPDEDLSDWDFFVFVTRSFSELKKIALAWEAPADLTMSAADGAEVLILVKTGMRCPHAGIWVPLSRLDLRRKLSIGDLVPDAEGSVATWVWVGAGL